MKLTPREYALIVIMVILVGAVIGDTANRVIGGWQDSQEAAAANSAPQLTDESLAANALNERAMRQDHLPDPLLLPR